MTKGINVFTAAGEKIGTLGRVVIDAETREATDLAVDRKTFDNEKVIPVGLVDVENEHRIMLRHTHQGADDFLDYETTQYVPSDHITSSPPRTSKCITGIRLSV